MVEAYYVDISTKSTENHYKFVMVLDRESHDFPNHRNGFYGKVRKPTNSTELSLFGSRIK